MTRHEAETELANNYQELELLQAAMRHFRTSSPSPEEMILPMVKDLTECQVRIFALEELLRLMAARLN